LGVAFFQKSPLHETQIKRLASAGEGTEFSVVPNGNSRSYIYVRGTRWYIWLRHCTTSQKVTGLIPDGVTGFFIAFILPTAVWPWDWLSHQQKWLLGIFLVGAAGA
jgi:hypothetical protein